MMSDIEIHEAIGKDEIKIEGVKDLHIGPSSIDLHLDNKARILSYSESGIDIRDANLDDNFVENNDWNSIAIAPGGFYLLSTKEKITLADDIGAFVQGRSSIGRLGINIHCAGYCDVGFSGTITLEVSNFTSRTVILPVNTRICQLVFFRTGIPAQIPYGKKPGAKYQNQSGPTITKIGDEYAYES